MFGMLWLILHGLALLVEGGVSSGSGEVAGGNGGGNNNNNNNGGVGGGVGAGINGVGINGGGLLQNAAFQLVPVGGSFFLRPVGNAAQGPQGPQGPVRQQQLVPLGAFQQGVGGFFLGPQGAANLIPQTQGSVVQVGAAGAGGVPLYAVLTQHAGPQGATFLQGQQLQLVPLNQQNLNQNNQQLQQQQGAVLGGARARARRSGAAHPRRLQVAATMGATMGATARTTAAAEEEESSGMDTEERMTL